MLKEKVDMSADVLRLLRATLQVFPQDTYRGGLMVKTMKMLKSLDCMSIFELPRCQKVNELNSPVKICSMNFPTR